MYFAQIGTQGQQQSPSKITCYSCPYLNSILTLVNSLVFVEYVASSINDLIISTFYCRFTCYWKYAFLSFFLHDFLITVLWLRLYFQVPWFSHLPWRFDPDYTIFEIMSSPSTAWNINLPQNNSPTLKLFSAMSAWRFPFILISLFFLEESPNWSHALLCVRRRFLYFPYLLSSQSKTLGKQNVVRGSKPVRQLAIFTMLLQFYKPTS